MEKRADASTSPKDIAPNVNLPGSSDNFVILITGRPSIGTVGCRILDQDIDAACLNRGDSSIRWSDCEAATRWRSPNCRSAFPQPKKGSKAPRSNQAEISGTASAKKGRERLVSLVAGMIGSSN